jgi:hypothetical protein
MSDAVRLRIELERALVRELGAAYDELNGAHFRSKLRKATIELSDASDRLGQWNPELRTVEISRKLAFEKPWGVVVEVLKHEMAHQFVHEVLGRTDEPPHGPSFRETCGRLGIDASAAGMPDAPERPESELRVLERVAKLLALAESPNANEAQAAASAAQRLMLKHNLDTASARASRGYSFRHLGRATGRISEPERLVAAILAEHFFVEAIWVPVYRATEGKRGRVLEVCGTPANLEMASYVHAFLLHAAERLWAEHKRGRGIRGDRDRRAYLAGVMIGFREKLEAQKRADAKAGLVWVGDAELHQYYRRRHPYVRHTHLEGGGRGEAHAHGREAGRNLVLHRGIDAPATPSGKLLPPGR